MDASFVTEEDIIEICITKGHIHPLGVFHYSTTELIVLFHLMDELQHTTCKLWKQQNCGVKPSLLRLNP